MLKLSALILFILFSTVCYCQTTKETIDREFVLIKQIPGRDGKKFIKGDKHFNAIAKLETAAMPYLVDMITDTSRTAVHWTAGRKLTKGDVAYALIIQIEFLVPVATVYGLQDCLLESIGPYNGFDYGLLNDEHGYARTRKDTQDQLKAFFLSGKGAIWFKIFHGKKKKGEQEELYKELDATTQP